MKKPAFQPRPASDVITSIRKTIVEMEEVLHDLQFFQAMITNGDRITPFGLQFITMAIDNGVSKEGICRMANITAAQLYQAMVWGEEKPWPWVAVTEGMKPGELTIQAASTATTSSSKSQIPQDFYKRNTDENVS